MILFSFRSLLFNTGYFCFVLFLVGCNDTNHSQQRLSETDTSVIEVEPTPLPNPDPKPIPEPIPDPEPDPAPEPDPVLEPKPEPAPEPDPVLEPKPEPAPEPDPVLEPDPELEWEADQVHYFTAKQSVYLTEQLLDESHQGHVRFLMTDPEQVTLGKFEFTNAETGAFTYLADAAEGEEVVSYRVQSATQSVVGKIIITIAAGDPLYQMQWHLQNRGQTAYAMSGGESGQDMNVKEAIAQGHHGENMLVAVIDDGLEISHPNLHNNILVEASYNFLTGTNDPTPVDASKAHGTAVAGIIAAEGWNNIGNRGVAPKASLMGFNYLEEQSIYGYSEDSFKLTHGIEGDSQSARIFNQSYGWEYPYPNNMSLREEALLQHAANEGKGRLFIKAAGNEYHGFQSGADKYFRGTNIAKGASLLPVYHANMSADQASFYHLMVSALNAEGSLSRDSTIGANIFVSAPGGEDDPLLPRIITTDRQGCHTGFSYEALLSGQLTSFDDGSHIANLDCHYTARMEGTSAAAPNISGAIAVIWGANPDLTWRDIRHILASTATQVDAEITDKKIEIISDVKQADFIAIPKWTTNAAGFHFHDFYGFGRVNVSDAVEMALNYNTDLGKYAVSHWIESNDIDKAIPDGSIYGVSDSIDFQYDWIVEGVQIALTINHQRLPDLAIELISPSGTRSVLLTPYNGYVASTLEGFENTVMLSHAFYGEKSQGDWRLKVTDVNSGEFYFGTYFRNMPYEDAIVNETNGELISWSLRIHGHAVN
ncbi:S8 family peptidase [uncultured Shewanella sp.]|uniref:S8 family peptidase n=1 Tax=uncultured Shewanella sp. TaxID=173975 RepID=UPI002637A7FA|nr:S8 family peptidase [uncultured Shewanella sp.]